MDVEPLGERYVRSMCHDIEDPTFDATAVATNPRAQVRPVHRPPRVPADRHPHCAWTVTIDDAFPAAQPSAGCLELMSTRAATLELDPIDRADGGAADYAGPLLSDVDFGAFSRSALARVADEVVVQMQLLALGFARAVSSRAAPEQARRILTKALTGVAGITAERLHRALRLPAGAAGALRLLELHPLLNPAAYVDARFADGVVTVAPSPAHEDGGWSALCGPGGPDAARPLRAIVRAADPRLDVRLQGSDTAWTLRLVTADEPAPELEEVAVTRFSTGAAFAFGPRRSLPITPVAHRPSEEVS
jgi:hypothetical protein